ncbi:MAG: M20/M25/M40 family metallo-hydrolase [Bacteroidetes bacterium]|nr:M20/M25/M40 family metallo-hydrolase [Bacteroidota bacterium]
MKAKKIFPVFLILCYFSLFSTTFSQTGYSPRIDSLINLVTVQTVSLLDRQLSGDTSCVIGGSPYTISSRYYASTSNPMAAQFIFERLQSYGYTPRYQTNSSTSVNVLAVKTGTKYPNQYYVISSHYDDMPSSGLAPGADDNASGTVAVLEAARILKNFNTDYSIIFATFDEEERGLYGSKAFVDTSYFHGDSIVCCLNFDMIAYDANNDGKCTIVYNTPSEGCANDYISAMRTYAPSMNPIKLYDLTANSDHASFWTRNYKAFMNIEDENELTPYYHTSNDKFSSLNTTYFMNIVRSAISALASMSNNLRMDFYHTPLTNGYYLTSRTAALVIKSDKPVAMGTSSAPKLYYKVNSGAFNQVNYSYYNQDTFKFTIPGQTLGSVVSYYFGAQDSAGTFVCTYPAGGRGLNPPGSTAPTTLFSYTIENINYACVGNGTATAGYPFYTYYDDARTDMLYLASELNISAPKILTKIGFNFSSVAAQTLNEFTIKLQNTSLTSLTGFATSGFTTVYSQTYTPPGTGWQYIQFTTPFYYDGSNLLVEVCFNNASWTSNSMVYATSAPNMTWLQYQDLPTGSGCTDLTAGSSQTNRPNICLTYDAGTNEGNIGSLLPKKFELSQNYPNPFNPVTKINFAVPKTGFVSVKVYDVLGKEVAALVREVKQAGYYSVDFNGADLSSGVYYCRMEAGDFVDVKKMILVK